MKKTTNIGFLLSEDKVTMMTFYCNFFWQMYGDNLENLEKITMELVADMVNELAMVAEKEPTDVYPIYHRCTTGIISSIVSAS